ncbi:MAG: hypothetical protein ACPGU5_04095 [Lishizhenia sp.]
MLEQITAWNDILPGILWLIILGFYFHYQFAKKGGTANAKFYLSNFYFKIALATAFGLTYALLLDGGDTYAYFQCAEKLNQLFFVSPKTYFSELFNTPTLVTYYENFSPELGYPPGWIYKEPESYLISKLLSIISFFTFNSYWAITVVLAGISASITYSFYLFIRKKEIVSELKLALVILFIPSVSFWCTGISKDTFVFLGILTGVISGLSMLKTNQENRIFHIVLFIISCYLLLKIRTFFLLTLLVPLFISFSVKVARRFSGQIVILQFIRFLIFSISLLAVVTYLNFSKSFGSLSPDNIIQEATITQQDFSQNSTYGEDKYEIKVDEYSYQGLLKVSPQSIFAGIYRPLPNEASKLSLIINGLESFVLLLLTLLFIYPVGLKKRIVFIRKSELLVFCLFFSLILAFMTGFSSGLFGVLVRLRAPLLPFFALLLVVGIWGKYKYETKE